MMFSKAEYEHLLDAEHARLACIGREGTAQIFPVNFIINLHTGAIDIVGRRPRCLLGLCAHHGWLPLIGILRAT